MKRLLFISCVALLAACNNAGTGTDTKKDSTGTDATVAADKKPLPEMPYKLDRPYQNWRPGDPQHAVTAQAALKGFEDGDIAASMKNFGDSVDFRDDMTNAKFSHDSLTKYFTMQRNGLASFKVKMFDWESVISDDKEQWVTLWYKQIMTDKKGKTDSVSVVDDCKIENGKIVVLDEKVRHYPAAKK